MQWVRVETVDAYKVDDRILEVDQTKALSSILFCEALGKGLMQGFYSVFDSVSLRR